jgi:3-methyladenine DNA glycosylase AlkD
MTKPITLQHIQKDLASHADPEKATFHSRFFKTGKGEYGEGDTFLGITVPVQRKIATQYKTLSLTETEQLLHSPYHEHRLTALLILVLKYEKGLPEEREQVYTLYITNLRHINNWDLVDASAHKIVGPYLIKHPKKQNILFVLAKSDNLWERRVAIIATWAYIKQKQFDMTLKVSEILLHDTHDLIHKAVGWMLREVGKIDQTVEEQFLDKHAKTMPRTMLRYAIERLEKEKREHYMKNV